MAATATIANVPWADKAAAAQFAWLDAVLDPGRGTRLTKQAWGVAGGVFATSGKMLVFVADVPQAPAIPEELARTQETVLHLIQTPADEPLGVVDMAALQAFAAPACPACKDAGGGAKCEECDGEGVIECYACENETECRDCSGRGRYKHCPTCRKERAADDRRYCRIGRLFCDRNILCLIPQQLQGGVAAGFGRNGNDRVLMLDGKSAIAGADRAWRVVVMPLLTAPAGEHPSLAIAPPQGGEAAP